MNSDTDPVAALVWTFALMSLIAVGGANSAISRNEQGRGRRSALDERPVIRRYLRHFPAFAGAECADRDADRISGRGCCGRLGRSGCDVLPDRRARILCEPAAGAVEPFGWPAIIQAALVPLSIGARGLILAVASDRSWVTGLMTASAAALAFATRLNPLRVLLAGGAFGFAGVA